MATVSDADLAIGFVLLDYHTAERSDADIAGRLPNRDLEPGRGEMADRFGAGWIVDALGPYPAPALLLRGEVMPKGLRVPLD